MSTLLLLTNALQPSAEVLPGLALLGHQVKILPAEGSALLEAPDSDLVLVDGRQDLAHARDLCRLIRTTGTDVPVLLVVTEGGLSVVTHDWGMDDVLLHTCGPAELEARIKLAIGRLTAQREAADPEAHVIRSGEVIVDDATYTAKIGKRHLDLTFKEFELLKFLAQHPGRVFSRQQLLQEVWGYDYFGGTRTVDVHVRRLRAKLGPDNETLIGTVRNVGYRFVIPAKEPPSAKESPRLGRGHRAVGADHGLVVLSRGHRGSTALLTTRGAAFSTRCVRPAGRPASRTSSTRPPSCASSTTGWPAARCGWPARTGSRSRTTARSTSRSLPRRAAGGWAASWPPRRWPATPR